MIRHSIIETPGFISDAKEAGITDEERTAIVDHFARNPADGAMIQGTGGARKVRLGGRGKGKSGGYRVIAYYGGHDIPVFLLNVFAKGDKVDLSKSECNELRKELEGLAEDYRRGVRHHVESG
jgi:hypothetical protein